MTHVNARLTILYDNLTVHPDCQAGWGFSCLVEREGFRLLFDTGWDGGQLLANADHLGVNLDEIDAVFISHGHWDHMGGLPDVLRRIEVPVYVPASLSKKIQAEIDARSAARPIGQLAEIEPGLISTGQFDSTPVEHCLMIEVDDGVVVVTGCAHPGLETIIARAEQHRPVRGLIGGFHDFDTLDRLADPSIETICPCHCTKARDEILTRFADRAMAGGVGTVIEI